MAQASPEIEIIAEPNVATSGGHPLEGLLVLGGIAAGLYLLSRATGAPLTAGVVDGDFVEERYPAAPVGPCDQAQATLVVVNPTDATKTYTILGTITNSQGQVVAHWWPDGAQGASTATAYAGLSLTVPPLSTGTVTATTSPWSLPGTFGTQWVLQWNGRTLTTRTRAVAFTTQFTSPPTQCGSPA